MPKRTEKQQETRPFSFRLPVDVFDDLAAVARSRGVDISGLLNWIIAEYRPALVKEQAAHEKAMLEAAASRPWAEMGTPAEALRNLRELVGRLQDEYAALSKQALGRAG